MFVSYFCQNVHAQRYEITMMYVKCILSLNNNSHNLTGNYVNYVEIFLSL